LARVKTRVTCYDGRRDPAVTISPRFAPAFRWIVACAAVSCLLAGVAMAGPGAPAFDAMMKAWQAGRIDDAVDAADAVLKAEPANVGYLNAIGGLYCEKAQRANVLSKLSWAGKCRATFERARDLDPRHLGVHTSLVRFYLQAPGVAGGGAEKADAEATRIAAIDPVAGEISRGFIARSRKQPAEAERHYRKAAELDVTGRRGDVELSSFLANEKRWADARAVFETRLAKDTGDTFAAYMLARLLQTEGVDLARAIELFDRYLAAPPLEGGPTHADAWLRKGQAFAALGRRADAIAAVETSLKLQPGHAAAARELQKLKG
jgi:tetratricopeptide (TPR) repeat protein